MEGNRKEAMLNRSHINWDKGREKKNYSNVSDIQIHIIHIIPEGVAETSQIYLRDTF
jgi:hypothetical protein